MDGEIEGAPHRVAREPQHGERVAAELPGEREPRLDRVPLDDPVDEAHRERLFRLHHAPGHDDVERVRLADEARQPLGPAVARHEPELDLREPHAGRGGREPEGAGHRELEAAPEGEPVDDRDRRDGQARDPLEEGLAEAEPPAVFEGRAARELRHVGPGAERAVPRPGDEERPHLALPDPLLDLRHPRLDLAEDREAQGVERFRAVEGEDGGAAAAFQFDRHPGLLGDEEAGVDHRAG